MRTKSLKLIMLAIAAIILSGCEMEVKTGAMSEDKKDIINTVEVKPVYEYYTITGSTPLELNQQIQKLAPVVNDAGDGRLKALAYMQMTIERHYQSRGTSKSCKLTNIRSVAIPTFMYPKWERPENPSQKTVEKWEKVMEALKIHEEEHMNIALKGVTEMQQVLESIPPYPTCDELKKVTGEKSDEIDDKYVEMNIKYDDDTNHGETQGVTLQ